MSITSVESRGPRNVEIGLRSLDQQKAIALEESDDYKLLGDLTRFVESSDQSIPRIAALFGVSDAVLSMWIARTVKPAPIKLLEIRRFLERYGLERAAMGLAGEIGHLTVNPVFRSGA